MVGCNDVNIMGRHQLSVSYGGAGSCHTKSDLPHHCTNKCWQIVVQTSQKSTCSADNCAYKLSMSVPGKDLRKKLYKKESSLQEPHHCNYAGKWLFKLSKSQVHNLYLCKHITQHPYRLREVVKKTRIFYGQADRKG